MRSLPPRGASPVDVALPAASEAARQLPAVLAQWHPVALRRLVLVLTLALAGLAYGWAMDADALEPYYAAAARSMSMSWHNFLFGAFDPAATLSLDKLPGAFWLQALAVRAFGFHTWAMVLPQVIEGVLTLLVVYRAVRRLAGPTAGLIAALVLALSPATVALNRGNISDSLMILLLALGADALSSALVTGSSASLVLAGVTVGLAFQAKMIEAWMVLPAFGLVYLLSGPGALKRRIGQLVLGGAVVAVVSVSWMTWVSLVPAVDRPYVDGSQTDSPYEQVFAYNGFGRFGDQTPLQVLAGQTPGLGLALSAPPVAPTRLLRGDLGHATGWLLPAALLVAGWGIISRRGRPRTDRLRACYVLWGGWVATFSAVFSLTTTINAYYTAALAPAVAAVFGAGVAGAWSEDRSGAGRRIGLVLVVASTTAYAAWLVVTAGSVAPSWLAPASVLVGIVAVGIALGAIAVRGDTCWAAALVAGLGAAVLAPAVASAELVVQHQGALDTPFESMAARQAIDALFVRTPAEVSATLPRLEQARGGAPYLLATQTAAIASVFIDASGQEALPIGGFDGSMPSPTLEQLQAEIRAGQFHLVLMAPSDDPRLQWIAAHCQNLGPAADGLHAYVCTPADAR